jgi:glycerol transport system ATP-binding protein
LSFMPPPNPFHEGHLEQFGSTIDVYQHPQSTRIAQAFSDPAMNFFNGTIESGTLLLGNKEPVPLRYHLTELPTGNYQCGMRPSHLRLQRKSAEDIEFQTTIDLVEISGSETFIHTSYNGHTWTSQQQGIHSYQMGQSIRAYVDLAQLYVFNLDGHLVASPKNASTELI